MNIIFDEKFTNGRAYYKVPALIQISTHNITNSKPTQVFLIPYPLFPKNFAKITSNVGKKSKFPQIFLKTFSTILQFC